MRIWIDITNSPHVSFFSRMIRELTANHEVIITCRDLANTIQLLRLEGFRYYEVGSHFGRNSIRKGFGFPLRVWQLVRFLQGKGIDAAISHSSFYSPLAARLLGIPCIYINDNEHAMGNWLAMPAATLVLLPECLAPLVRRQRWDLFASIRYYPGVKEGVYLWNATEVQEALRRRRPAGGAFRVFFRPEPWLAQYYSKNSEHLDQVLVALAKRFDITVLPRSIEQANYYSQKRFNKLKVLREARSLGELVESCDAFLGAGGTMTRELAVLGVPTVSLYQAASLLADDYLATRGLLKIAPNTDSGEIVSFLETRLGREPDRELMTAGREAYEMIMGCLLEVAAKN